jgi:hypothetical protein
MNSKSALVVYYTVLTLGYVWAIVQLITKQPFDAWVLFIVTYSFHTYRNSVKKELDKL